METRNNSLEEKLIDDIYKTLVDIVYRVHPITIGILNMRAFLRMIKQEDLPPLAREYCNAALDLLIDFEVSIAIVKNDGELPIGLIDSLPETFEELI